MAAPETISIENLTGDFVMNKKLSDDFEPVLALQGIGWVTRKAIGLATVTLHIKQYKDDNGVVHIDIEQTATGGVKGTTELRHLNYEEREHDDHIFGKVRGKSRFIKMSQVDDAYLKSNWLPETENGDAIESNVTSVDNGWEARQIWGFQEKNGQRMYSRNILVTKGNEKREARLYYDYLG